MVVGESPGPDEDVFGLPFVGPSGDLLQKFFIDLEGATPNQLGIQNSAYLHGKKISVHEGLNRFKGIKQPDHQAVRDVLLQNVYLTNAVMCFNAERKPTNVDIKACQDRLYQEIYWVDPRLIFAFGSYALKALFGTTTKLAVTKVNGMPQILTLPGYRGSVNYYVVPVVHPAFILRDGGTKSPWYDRAFKAMGKALLTLGGINVNGIPKG